MKTITYRDYRYGLSNGFDALPVLVGKAGVHADFKAVKIKPKDYKDNFASLDQVRNKKRIMAILENGPVRVERRGHNRKTEELCYLTKP
jgi:hypothetical protein